MSKSDFISETSILLPTRAASSGATVNKTEYLVVDGMTSYIYVFSFCGEFKGAIPVLRPYKKIVYCMDTDTYFALGNGCGNVIYTLNCRLEETDRINTDCSSLLLDISISEIKEASPVYCGNSLMLTTPHSIEEYTKGGKRLNSIAVCDSSTFYSSFVKTSAVTAESFLKGSYTYLRLTENCDEQTLIIPPCVTLKNLFSTDGGGIYGFFSKNYANNYIVPIYENDSVNLSFFNSLNKSNKL